MTPEALNVTTLIAVVAGTATIVTRMATKSDLKDLRTDTNNGFIRLDGRIDKVGERNEQLADRQHADMMGVMGRDRDFDTRITTLENATKDQT
jgi:hypothetical protein